MGLTNALSRTPLPSRFDSLIFQELLFQLCLSSLEVFCRARRDLRKPGHHNCTLLDTSLRSAWRSTYIWILAYCVSSAATTIPRVYTILVTPNAVTATTTGTLALSSAQKHSFIYHYIPLLPLYPAPTTISRSSHPSYRGSGFGTAAGRGRQVRGYCTEGRRHSNAIPVLRFTRN